MRSDTRALTALVLLLSLPAARGDCSRPPDVPNALPDLEGRTSFSEGTHMTYKCKPGFVKVPGRPDTALCSKDQWSGLAEFCNRSCNTPTRLLFASLQKTYNEQNYFPVDSIVEYECRPGFQRVESLSKKITCLSNLSWSKAEEFCKKKSCPNPGEIKNGNVSIATGILYGATVTFSCDEGYSLVGADSSFCGLEGDTVGWTDPLPECREIACPAPPQIEHAVIQELQSAYTYGQSVRYECAAGFALVGEGTLYCTAEADHGVWSSPHPVCKAKPRPAAPRTTARTQATSTVPARGPPSSRASIIASGCVAGIVVIGTLILVKIFWHCGKSGSYDTCENSTLSVMCHSSPVAGAVSEARPGKSRKDAGV